jgi:hypothetical protein
LDFSETFRHFRQKIFAKTKINVRENCRENAKTKILVSTLLLPSKLVVFFKFPKHFNFAKSLVVSCLAVGSTLNGVTASIREYDKKDVWPLIFPSHLPNLIKVCEKSPKFRAHFVIGFGDLLISFSASFSPNIL